MLYGIRQLFFRKIFMAVDAGIHRTILESGLTGSGIENKQIGA
jgi:hypothetical protein